MILNNEDERACKPERFSPHPAGGDHLKHDSRNQRGNPAGVPPKPSPLFAGIPASEYSRICSTARAREFTRGQMLYLAGDAVQHVFLLTGGLVKIVKFGQSGTEVITALAAPGDVLGAVGLFANGRHPAAAQAFRTSRTLLWEAAVFKALLAGSQPLRQNMVRILDEYSRELEQRFHEVATERVGARVARQLMRLLKRIGEPVHDGIEVGLSREELAQMTGTTLFTVSRLLSAWENLGIVRPQRGAVTICNIELLQDMSQETTGSSWEREKPPASAEENDL